MSKNEKQKQKQKNLSKDSVSWTSFGSSESPQNPDGPTTDKEAASGNNWWWASGAGQVKR